MKSNQYKLKTRKRSLKNKKTSKVLVKKVKKSNKKGGGNSVLVLAPEEITDIVGIIENAGFDYEFDEQCRNNELLQKLFNNSQPNCHMFFLELIKKVSLLKMLMDNNKNSFDLLEPRNNNRGQKIKLTNENKIRELASFRNRIVDKIEQKKCTPSQLNEFEKKEFVNFINKVFNIDNALNKLNNFLAELNQENKNQENQNQENQNQGLKNFGEILIKIREQLLLNKENIDEMIKKIILNGFGIENTPKCEISFKIFNLLRALNALDNKIMDSDKKEILINTCLKKLLTNIEILNNNNNVSISGGSLYYFDDDTFIQKIKDKIKNKDFSDFSTYFNFLLFFFKSSPQLFSDSIFSVIGNFDLTQTNFILSIASLASFGLLLCSFPITFSIIGFLKYKKNKKERIKEIEREEIKRKQIKQRKQRENENAGYINVN